MPLDQPLTVVALNEGPDEGSGLLQALEIADRGTLANDSTKLHLRNGSFLSALKGRISDLHTPQLSVLLFESERLKARAGTDHIST